MTYREPPSGWFTFGTHVDKPVPLEFSTEVGDDGMPLWERPFTPVNDCPECRQGKHVNCTQMVLVEHDLTDNYEPCPCKMREHQEEEA